jgi:hypothetical protein
MIGFPEPPWIPAPVAQGITLVLLAASYYVFFLL